MDAKKTILLRHRFDDVEQLRRHLHEVDGSTLLFFRDPTLSAPTGAGALVELAFESSEQTRVLRATVLARAEKQGLWSPFPTPGSRVKSASAASRRAKDAGSASTSRSG